MYLEVMLSRTSTPCVNKYKIMPICTNSLDRVLNGHRTRLASKRLLPYPLVTHPRPPLGGITQWRGVVHCIDTASSEKTGVIDVRDLRQGAHIDRSQPSAPHEE